jgi:DNA invertase Pin-like site-specific DNA recombinase
VLLRWFGSRSCVWSSPRSGRLQWPRASAGSDGLCWAAASPIRAVGPWRTQPRDVSRSREPGSRTSPRQAPVASRCPRRHQRVGVLVGYARCSTDKQDLAAQRHTLRQLGVSDDRMYLDHGVTGRNRRRPGLQQALAAVRRGDTLVVPKLDRLARSVPDAREIGDSLAAGGVRLSIGGTVYDPTDPMGKMFFNILATFAEFEVDLLRLRTREGMAIARANGKLKGKQTQAQRSPTRPRPRSRPVRRSHHRGTVGTVLSQPRHDLPRNRAGPPRPATDRSTIAAASADRSVSSARTHHGLVLE